MYNNERYKNEIDKKLSKLVPTLEDHEAYLKRAEDIGEDYEIDEPDYSFKLFDI